MNASPETNQNPREPLKTTNGAPATRENVLAAILFAIASITVPVSLTKPWVGMGLWAAMLVGSVVLLRRMRLGVTLTLLVSLAAFLLSGAYLFVGPLVTALAVGTFAGAFLMTSLEKPYLACLSPLLATAVAVAFTQDPLLIVSALALLPAAALTAFATKRKMGRSSIICFGAGGLLGTALILFAVALARTEAGFSIETVRSLLDTWKAAVLADQIEMRNALLEMLERAYENSGAAGTQSAQTMMDYYRRLMSDAALESELTRIFNVLPGAVAAAALIAAFLGQRLLLDSYDAAGMRSLVTPESEFLVLSLPAAITYVVCLILQLIFDTSYAVPVVTAENLLVILTPGLCAVGWGALTRFYRSVPPRGRGALIVPAIALLCCASSSILYVLAAYGAYATIFSAVRRAILRRGGPNPPAGGPFDGGNGGDDDSNDSNGGNGNPFD
ncbi:MAG TPA: hypothetical protein DDW30_05705 [Clostridiales bacterium]|nr:hypothetical protein [Clostridiales bacterium]